MRWMLKFQDGSVFTSESMIETNNKLLTDDNVVIMEVKHLDKLWKVDYDTGHIYCNGDMVFENITDAEPRWVSYREVIGEVGTNKVTRVISKTYYFGWQATVNGVNIKRLIEIDPLGNCKLILYPEVKNVKEIS